MLVALLPHVKHLIVTRPPNPKAQDPKTVASAAARRDFACEAVDSPDQALASARRKAGNKGELVVTGSISLVGEVKRLLLLQTES